MGDIGYAISRVAIPILFIISGIGKFLNISGISNSPGVTNFMVYCPLRVISGHFIKSDPCPLYPRRNAFGEIATRTTLGYTIATIEVIGGISVLIGFRTRWGAVALILFTACTIIFAHNFWTMEGGARAANQVQALKNLAIMGGLLMFAVMGSGRYSVDSVMNARV